MKTYSKIFKFLFIAYGIIVFTLLSCDGGHQIDYNLKTNFIYKNLTSEDLEIILYDKENTKFQTYSIAPSKQVEVVISGEGPKTGINPPFWIRNDSRYIATKVTIKFIRGFIKGGVLAVSTTQNYKWTFKYLLEHLVEEREWFETHGRK